MRVIVWISIPLLIVAGGIVVLSILLNDVVTSRYATLADARSDGLVARGWLPDILPASARQIRTSNNLDVNTSEGEFRFAPGDYEQFSSRLRPYIEVKEPWAVSADEVARKRRRGFEAGAYSEDRSTWVFFCRPAEGFCEYTMWLRRAPSELVPTDQQVIAADHDPASQARRRCVTSLCTRGALDTRSRSRSTAALGDSR